MDSLAEPSGLSALFLLSFLAATLLPVGSEWLLIAMVAQGFPSDRLVLAASLGNFLGACTTYLIGIAGSDIIIHRILRIDDRTLERAGKIYGKYGAWSLTASWLPVVGDALCLVAGIFRMGFCRFALPVFVGKFARYAALALLTAKISGA